MSSVHDSCVLGSTRATKDPYFDTNSNNMLAAVLTPRQLARQVGGSVKCDSSSTMAGATHLITRAGGTALDGGVGFPNKSPIMNEAFPNTEAQDIGRPSWRGGQHTKQLSDLAAELLSMHSFLLISSLGDAPTLLESTRFQAMNLLASILWLGCRAALFPLP